MKVYLHIGFGKTGTTSIQDYLFFNREVRKSDYFYPEIGLRGSGHHNLATYGKDEFSDFEKNLYANLKQNLKNLNEKIPTIISSEFFCFSKPSCVKNIYYYLHEFDVGIVFYFRKQVPLIQSAFLQWQRMGWNYQGTIEDFFKVHAQSFDFMKRIGPWAEFFGEKRILARLYDRDLIGEDVCADFLKLIGVNLVNYQPLKAPSNESILPDFSEIISLIDKNGISGEERQKIIKKIVELSKRFRPFSNYTLIDVHLSDNIRKFYDSSNEEFAKIFLTNEQSEKFLT
jgi:hypothetical protein